MSPISASRELRKDGSGGGGVARRARAAQAPKAKSPNRALRPVLRPKKRPAPRPSRARPSRAHPSRVAQWKRWKRHACVGRGFRRWKMTRAAMSTFPLPSSAQAHAPLAIQRCVPIEEGLDEPTAPTKGFERSKGAWRGDEETVTVGLTGCARDQPCASWGST